VKGNHTAEGQGQFSINMVERMMRIGFIDGQTSIFATHINPHQGLSHDELQEHFDDSGVKVTVAYDGLTLT
jgi:hypothetical protein